MDISDIAPLHEQLCGMLLLKRSHIPLWDYPRIFKETNGVNFEKLMVAVTESHQEIRSLSQHCKADGRSGTEHMELENKS